MDKVVHFEVPFDDGERATNFYREAFGWDLNSMPSSSTRWSPRPRPTSRAGPPRPAASTAGCWPGRARSPRRSSPSASTDLDDALARVEKLGGKVAIGRQPVGDMGFSAYFHDTEGNLIGLWQNA